MKDYQEARKWSDAYIPAMNQLAAHFVYTGNLMSVEFKRPSLIEDRRAGIDMWINTGKLTVSYRTRRAEQMAYFLNGFTIRTSSTNGFPSELDKVMAGTYPEFLLYALADGERIGELQAGVMIDMKSVGAQLKANPELLDKATKGSDFIDFPYKGFFSEPVVVGIAGVKELQ